MSTTFINPNWHVILIHYPLGLLGVGVAIELFSFLWRASTLRVAGRWMILLGALALIPTAMSGLYAFRDVATRGLSEGHAGEPWRVVAQNSPLSAQEWRMLSWHLWLEISATVVSALAAVFYVACADHWREQLRWPLLIVLLAGVGAMGVGAWFSGESVYRHGTGVQRVYPTPPQHASEGTPAAERPGPGGGVEYYVPPLQLHVIAAGATIALALGALGVAFRAITRMVLPPAERVGGEKAPVASTQPPTGQEAYVAALRGITPAPDQTAGGPRLPSARLMLVSAVAALFTAGVGYWFLAHESDNWNPATLWPVLWNWEDPRRIAHVLSGVTIVVLLLILAAIARWASRRAALLGIFSVLLVLVVAWQVWLGVLMLFDSHHGPLVGFN